MNLKHYTLELAHRVYNRANINAVEDEYSIDPATILMIAQIVMQIIEFIVKWYKKDDKGFTNRVKSQNFISRFIIWHFVRKEVGNRKDARYIYKSLIETGGRMSETELNKLYFLAREEKNGN